MVASPAQSNPVSGLITLCTLTVQIDPSATPNQSYIFNSMIQTFTDGTNAPIMPGGRMPPTATTFLDRNGYSLSGTLFVGSTVYSSILAFSPRAEFVNTAILGDAMIKSTITLYKVSSLGSFAATTANCSSSNISIIQVNSACGYLFLNGSETSGGSITVTVSANGFPQYTFSARAWAPQIPITVSILDPVLNLVSGYYNSSNNCSQAYQASTVSATIVFNRSLTDTMTIVLPPSSSLLSAALVSSSASVASLSVVNGLVTVQGVSVGSASLSYKVGSTVLGAASVSVVSAPVSVSRLRVIIYQSFSASLNATNPVGLLSSSNTIAYTAVNLLTQELQLAYVEAYAIFNDTGLPLYLTPSLGLQLFSYNPNVVDIPTWQNIRARGSGSGMLIAASWSVPTCQAGNIGTGMGQVFVNLPPALGVTINLVNAVIVPAGDPSTNVGYSTSTYFTILLKYTGGVNKNMTIDPRFVI